MARSYLLKGAVATPARNHGLTSHYEKAGGKNAMLRDFYAVQPTKISDDLVGCFIYENMPIQYKECFFKL